MVNFNSFKKIKFRYYWGIISLIIAHATINHIWLKKDNFPLWYDYAGYFKRSIEIYYALPKGFATFVEAILGIGRYISAYRPHRIILPLSSIPWYFIFGLDPDVAIMGSTAFLAISLFSIYAIASRLFDKKTGLMAAFILSVSPGFFTLYRRYSPEFATIALVALAAYSLLRSQNFQSRLYSILFGIGFGLSMITKEMALAFIPGILIYAVYKSQLFYIYNPITKERKKALINLIISLLVAGIIILPIYWLHRYSILGEIFHVAYSPQMRTLYGMVGPYSLQGLIFYFKRMFDFSFLPFYSIFFVWGIFYYAREKSKNKGFIFCWLISSYIMLCSTQTRTWVYSVPLLIPLAIIAAYGINKIFKGRIIRVIFLIFIITWGIAQLLFYSFPIVKLNKLSIVRRLSSAEEFYPVNEDWKLDNVLDCIRGNLDNPNSVYRVHVGANLYAFSPMTLSYVATQKRLNLLFSSYDITPEEALTCDFVIIKKWGDQGIFYSPQEAKELADNLDKNNKFVKLPNSFIFPDKSAVEIYKKILE